MHRSAMKSLKRIEFENDWHDRHVRYAEYSDDDEDLVNRLVADLQSQRANFKAILDACCSSQVPPKVAHAFESLENECNQQSYEQGGRASDLGSLKFLCNRMEKEFSKYWLWPINIPSIEVSKKVREWKEGRAELKSQSR